MKVFVPISDALLARNGLLSETLVPFNPDFLSDSGRGEKGCKPANWISDTDYASACKRLRQERAERTSG